MNSQTVSKVMSPSFARTSASSLMSATICRTPSGTAPGRLPRFKSQTSQAGSAASRRVMAALILPVPPMKSALMVYPLLTI